MPNWCCVNIVAKGKHEQLQRLANDLNSMRNIGQSRFGRLWLGNLVAKCLNAEKDGISVAIME